MRFTKCLGLFATILVGAVAIVGCDPAETRYRDYLNATVNVKAGDGVTPVSGLAVQAYDWVIKYKDGSTVTERFEDPSFVTAKNGGFNFLSGELALQSGHIASDCTRVCVEESYYYDYRCVEWDLDGYCTWEEQYPVWYCTRYMNDCDYYYPTRNIDDIELTYAEITYGFGTSAVTTPSEAFTTPEQALATSKTPFGKNDTLVEFNWAQDDVFITPVSSNLAVSGKSKLARRPVARKPSVIMSLSQLDELSTKQKQKLEEVRKLCGATKR